MNVSASMVQQVAEQYNLDREGVVSGKSDCDPFSDDSIETIQYVCNWLEDMDLPKRKTRTLPSYLLKHYAEHCRGDYVTNGEFIIGAILMGYTPRHIASTSNMNFNISVKDVHKILKERGVDDPASYAV